jgi:CRP/FNR family transcriptional regulator, anaerobic regulatory protein
MPVRTPVRCRPPAAELKVACSSCSLRELCLPVGFTQCEMARLDGLVSRRIGVERGDSLYRCGDAFEALYALRTGFFKTRTASEDGREHVIGFQMAGELLGLDGIGSGLHACDAVALEDSHVCVIRYEDLERRAREFEPLQRQFHRILGREIVRDHGVMMLLVRMRAEERLAAFLLNLAQRLHARGFSPTSFVLRMTRQEIGTYLGLNLETVSRCFSKFHAERVLQVELRDVRILDVPALEAMTTRSSA